MDKDFATFRLGGSDESAARWIGIAPDIYREWPERLHRIMADRVYAAVLRRDCAKALGLTAKQYFSDPRAELILEGMLSRVSIAAVAANLLDPVPPDMARTAEEKPERRPYTRRDKPALQALTSAAS